MIVSRRKKRNRPNYFGPKPLREPIWERLFARRRRRRAKSRLGRVWAAVGDAVGWLLIMAVRAGAVAFFPVAFTARWFIATWEHRRLKYLLRGLPALLVGGAVITLAAVVQIRADSLVDGYADSAQHFHRQEDYSMAKLCYERVIDLAGEKDYYQFNLALTLEKLEEKARAESIMKSLAPLEQGERGFAEAHLWIAAAIVNDRANFQDPRHLDYAIAHLKQAKLSRPKSAQIDYQLARCFLRLGANDSALRSLERAADLDPIYNFELFQIRRKFLLGANLDGYLLKKRIEETKEAATKANSYYQQFVERNPRDRLARIRWADIRAGLGDFAGCEYILKQGVKIDPRGPFQKALSGAYVSHFRSRLVRQRSGKEEKDLPGLLALLRKALTNDSDSIQALQELAEFGIGEQDEQVNELLDNAIVQGQGGAFAHFVKGARAWQRGDHEQSLFHMERAYKMDDNMAAVANNLAFLLCFRGEESDLERGLGLINSVLEKFPQDPDYRDTRGQILVKMGRYQEALDDLEFALPVLGKNPRLHRALEKAYRHLGQERLAIKHADLARDLEKKSDPASN